MATHRGKTKQNKKRKGVKKSAKPRSTASASTAIVVARPPERPWELDNEQLTILKNSVAKGATDEELKFCLTVARRYKLDPFRQQIWFIKRWDSGADNGKGGRGAYVWSPQVGIYGMLHIAARDHADYGTLSKPEYGPEITIEVEGHKIKGPQWCTVQLWKKGLSEPSVGEAWFEEYCPKVWDNAKLFWAKYQHRMIAKCAKAQAAREAYPDLGGLLIPEECQRGQDDFTESGRQIVEQEERPSRQIDSRSTEAVVRTHEEMDRLFAALVQQGRPANEETAMEAERMYREGKKASPEPPVPQPVPVYDLEGNRVA